VGAALRQAMNGRYCDIPAEMDELLSRLERGSRTRAA
jgi:hypothetical protein